MEGFDDIIHQPLRLRIMAALHAARNVEPLEFARLKRLTGATDGNLGSHLNALEGAGYLAITKDFAGKRPRTRAAITRAGERAFQAHTDCLRDLIDEARE